MRYDDLYISGIGSWLPKAVTVDEAMALGRYDAVSQQRSMQRSVVVSGPDDSQPEMAVRAGRSALRMSGHDPSEVAILLHAVAVYAGLDGWNVSSYLQQEILEGNGISFEIRQVSNGGLAGIELAAAYMAADPSRSAAMITAAECFSEPAWDRWRADAGLVFGDGAGALTLSQRGGFARIKSLVTTNDPSLEGLHRGEARFRLSPDPADYPLDLRSRAVEFSAATGLTEIRRRGHEGLRNAVDQALAEAGTSIDTAVHCSVPHFGHDLLHNQVLEPLGLDVSRTSWSLGSEVGHVGAADPFVALDHLVVNTELHAGDEVLLISLGGGFNWTCAVVQILESPIRD